MDDLEKMFKHFTLTWFEGWKLKDAIKAVLIFPIALIYPGIGGFAIFFPMVIMLFGLSFILCFLINRALYISLPVINRIRNLVERLISKKAILIA